ncbi:MAG: type VI secretion system baseplate subunit TssK [Nitrospirales bacterium]
MDVSHRVLWSEGMLLTPHIFQQWDRYHDLVLVERLQNLHPFGWGVCQLDIDKDGLENGSFTLLQFRGVMPDGLVIRVPEQDVIPATRLLEELFPPSLDHLDVFLGVPMDHTGMANCKLDQKALPREPRYEGSFMSIPDFNTGDNSKEIMVARKNLKIFFTGEDMPDSTIMKIAELTRSPGGTIMLREGYIAPLLWISGSESLTRLLRSLLELMVSMGTALADQQRGIREHGGMDLLRFSMLHSIFSYIPVLAHYNHVGKIHPETLFITLARLAGELLLMSPDANPKDLPLYEHTNLSRSFRELEIKIRNIVEHISPTRYVTIPLEKRGETIFVGQVSDVSLLEKGQFFLSVSGGESEDSVRSLLLKRVKIGAMDDMELIVNAAMPGVRFRHVVRPPASIPAKTGHQYFQWETQGGFWDRIKQMQNLSLYVPSELQEVKIEILVTKE